MLSENEDSRNCGCMMNTNFSSFMNNNINMTSCECDKFNQTREEMIAKIKCLNFAIIELALYLDTHVDDEKALCLHRKYCKEYRELTDKYQKIYGPLTIQFPCNKWRWIEEPWASFNLGKFTILNCIFEFIINFYIVIIYFNSID